MNFGTMAKSDADYQKFSQPKIFTQFSAADKIENYFHFDGKFNDEIDVNLKSHK